MTVAKFGLAFTWYLLNLKTIENSTVTDSVQSLQEFDAKEKLMPKEVSPQELFDLILKASKNVPFLSFLSVHMKLFLKCAGFQSPVFRTYRFQNL